MGKGNSYYSSYYYYPSYYSSYYSNYYGSYYYSSYYYPYYYTNYYNKRPGHHGAFRTGNHNAGIGAVGISIIIFSCLLGVAGTGVMFWCWKQKKFRRRKYDVYGKPSQQTVYRGSHGNSGAFKGYRDESTESGFSTSSDI